MDLDMSELSPRTRDRLKQRLEWKGITTAEEFAALPEEEIFNWKLPNSRKLFSPKQRREVLDFKRNLKSLCKEGEEAESSSLAENSSTNDSKHHLTKEEMSNGDNCVSQTAKNTLDSQERCRGGEETASSSLAENISTNDFKHHLTKEEMSNGDNCDSQTAKTTPDSQERCREGEEAASSLLAENSSAMVAVVQTEDGQTDLDMSGVSNSVSNLLARNEITTEEAFLALTEEEMSKWQSCGKKKLEELLDFQNRLRGGEKAASSSCAENSSINGLKHKQLIQWKKVKKTLQPFERVFKRMGILDATGLMAYSSFLRVEPKKIYLTAYECGEPIATPKNITKLAQEQSRFWSQIQSTDKLYQCLENYIRDHFVYIVDEDIYRETVQAAWIALCEAEEAPPEVFSGDSFSDAFICHLEQPIFIREILRPFAKSYTDCALGRTDNELCSAVREAANPKIRETIQANDFISFWLDTKVIFRNGFGRLEAYRPSICDEQVLSLLGKKGERNRDILEKYYFDRDSVLETIGQSYGLSRERVRQLRNDSISKTIRPVVGDLREDYLSGIYKYINQRYELPKDFISVIFKCSDKVANYLIKSNKYNQNGDNEDISEAMDDEKIPDSIKRGVEDYLHSKQLNMDGEYIDPTRPALLEYIIRKNASDKPMSIDNIKTIYDCLWREIFGLKEEDFEDELKTMGACLDRWPFTLKAGKRSYRYYLVDSIDMHQFAKTLGLHSPSYMNVELSAKKFYDQFPDYMDEIDIHNQYELHSLMKKNEKRILDEGIKITFKKQILDEGIENSSNKKYKSPIFAIGNVDRERQVVRFLKSVSPISVSEFIKEYCREFGIKKDTFLSNDFKYVKKYRLKDNTLDIDSGSTALDDDLIQRVKPFFPRKIYARDVFEEICSNRIPGISAEVADRLSEPANLKKLGFSPKNTKNTIFSAEYSSLNQALDTFFSSEEVIHLDDDDFQMISQQEAHLIVRSMKKEYKIAEVSPRCFLSKGKMEQCGLTPERIKDYCAEVEKFVLEDEGRFYFNVAFLRHAGFRHELQDELDDLGFEDDFCESLLCVNDRFIRGRIGGANVLRRRGSDEKRVSRFAFLRWLIDFKRNNGIRGIGIYDLIELLKADYGIELDRYTISELCKRSGLYYGDQMDKVYLNPMEKIYLSRADYEDDVFGGSDDME